MSNWDFGHGRQEPGDRRARYDPYDPYDPYGQQDEPYPVTYERDVFDGPPPRQAPPRPAGPRHAARPTSPGRDVPPRPAGPPDPPWPAAPPPAGRSGGERYTGGQPRYAGGDRGYAGRDPGFVRGRRGDAPPFPARPWAPGPPPAAASRSHAGRGQWDSADPVQAPYPDAAAGGKPARGGPRGYRSEGRWWDPDAWSGWQHWLFALGVAVAAALIGAALVLLSGAHHSAAAAAGIFPWLVADMSRCHRPGAFGFLTAVTRTGTPCGP
jgi:hypothetical protein